MKQTKIITTLIFLCFWVSFIEPIYGKTITLKSSKDVYSLDETMPGVTEIYYDSLGIYSSSNILDIPFKKRIDFGVFDPESDYKIWLKFTVKKDVSSTDSWVIYNVDQNVGGMELFSFQGHKLTKTTGGKDHPFYTRDLPIKHIATSLSLNPGEEKTYYICYTGKLYFLMWPRIAKLKTVIKFENEEYHLIAICYGILLIMIIYNIIMFGVIKDKKYIYYVFYVIFTAFFLTNGDSFLFQYLWPNKPIINTLIFYLARPLWVFFFILYAINFLKLPHKTKLYLWGFYLIFGCFSIYEVIIYQGIHYYFFPIVYVWISILSWQKYRRDQDGSVFFFIGSLLITIGIIDVTLLSKGLIKSAGFWHYYAIYIAVITEVVMYSISLVKQFNQHKKQELITQKKLVIQLEEKQILEQKVTKELEQKVLERTIELHEKNNRLKEVTQELNILNRQLDISLWEKGKEVKKVATELILKGNLSFDDFKKTFPEDLICLKYINELKWNEDQPFICKNCENKKWNNGSQTLSRKCSKCNRIESVTSNTIFHKLRFPLQKAFYIVYLVKQDDKKPIKEVSQELDLSVTTCAAFKTKIVEKLKIIKIQDRDWKHIIC